jgi:hypothetical protein
MAGAKGGLAEGRNETAGSEGEQRSNNASKGSNWEGGQQMGKVKVRTKTS